MNEAIRKAAAIVEALQYIRRFRDKIIVIKLGGSAMEKPGCQEAILLDVVFMATVGLRPVIVHGGGAAITRAMKAAGKKPVFIQGRRYTDDEGLAIATRVLCDEINGPLVAQIEAHGGLARGMVGPGQWCLQGERLTLDGPDGTPVDLGHVGRVTGVDVDIIGRLGRANTVPVIPCLAMGQDGGLLNVNADTAAGAVAAALGAEKLVVLSDTHGVLTDRNDPESLASSLTADAIRAMVERGTIDSGMLPKTDACLDALAAGVPKAHIIDGGIQHGLLLEIYTDRGIGTEIVLGDDETGPTPSTGR